MMAFSTTFFLKSTEHQTRYRHNISIDNQLCNFLDDCVYETEISMAHPHKEAKPMDMPYYFFSSLSIKPIGCSSLTSLRGAMMKAKKTLVLIFLLLIPAINVQAWVWPDTGQTKCYTDSIWDEITCPAPGQPFYGQDAQYEGWTRSYTKLGQNGTVLPYSATQANGWFMTRDNVTGLVWEMKTDDGGIHDKDNNYTWCDTNPLTNSWNQGWCGSGVTPADTEAFIKALNDAHFGGFSDWRMPTIKELSSLVNSSIPYGGPTIDAAWFPNTAVLYDYWSSTTYATFFSDSAWSVDFSSGAVHSVCKSFPYPVRAVRAGQ